MPSAGTKPEVVFVKSVLTFKEQAMKYKRVIKFVKWNLHQKLLTLKRVDNTIYEDHFKMIYVFFG